jgi:spermidine dehydrogenase
MDSGVFLDRENFGVDLPAFGIGKHPRAEVLLKASLHAGVRDDIVRLYEAKIGYLPGKTSVEKALLARTSYRDDLARIAAVAPSALPSFQSMSPGEWGIGADAVSALDVWAFSFPGFQGLGMAPGPSPGMGSTAASYAAGGSESFHFPDGNASITRQLVRRLVPGAMPGRSAEDVVLAQAECGMLDQADASVRIPLERTVLQVRHVGGGVEVAYRRGGETRRVDAANCILACWGMMTPFLCPDLPPTQAAALRSQVKVPLVYASVLVRDWQAFHRLGIARVQAPGGFFTSLRLD